MAAETYATVVELTDYLDIQGTDNDALLEARIEAASRAVDGWCGRVFFLTEETRPVAADTADLLILPWDLAELTAFATDDDDDLVAETQWELADVALAPFPGPFQVARPRRGRGFPTRRRIEITGTWGYSETIPAVVREATLLQASRLYKRKDAPFGVAGSVEHGQLQTITRIDPDVREMLAPYRRNDMVV